MLSQVYFIEIKGSEWINSLDKKQCSFSQWTQLDPVLFAPTLSGRKIQAGG